MRKDGSTWRSKIFCSQHQNDTYLSTKRYETIENDYHYGDGTNSTVQEKEMTEDKCVFIFNESMWELELSFEEPEVVCCDRF